MTAHNSHKRQTSMPPTGFENAIPATERPQRHILDRAATGFGAQNNYPPKKFHCIIRLECINLPIETFGQNVPLY